jgi:hypothetical protein
MKKNISEEEYMKYYAKADLERKFGYIIYEHWLWSSDSIKRLEMKKDARKKYKEYQEEWEKEKEDGNKRKTTKSN